MTKNPFKNKTITIIGLGGVGSNLANRLNRHNTSLRIIDRDRIYEADQQRLSLFSHAEVQKFKAKEAKKRLDAITPTATTKAFHEDLTDDNSFLIQGTIIFDASNDIKTNEVVMKKAASNKLTVIQINYAGSNAIVKFYQGKTTPVKFTKIIAKAGCDSNLVELCVAAALHQATVFLAKKKPKPEIKIDSAKFTLE